MATSSTDCSEASSEGVQPVDSRIHERAEQLIRLYEQRILKCKHRSVSTCLRCLRAQELIDDFEFLHTIDVDDDDTTHDEPWRFDIQRVFDLDTPLALPDLSLVPFHEVLKHHTLFARFFAYRQLDAPHRYLSHYFEWVPCLFKANIREEKLPIVELLLQLDPYLLATGETHAQEERRRHIIHK